MFNNNCPSHRPCLQPTYFGSYWQLNAENQRRAGTQMEEGIRGMVPSSFEISLPAEL